MLTLRPMNWGKLLANPENGTLAKPTPLLKLFRNNSVSSLTIRDPTFYASALDFNLTMLGNEKRG